VICFRLNEKTRIQDMSLKKSNLIKKLTLLIVGIAAMGISVTVFTLNVQNENLQYEIMDYDGIQKAVILDQLYRDYPNEEFHEKATEYLSKAGFKVDIFTTDELTVNFYKKLPSMNYEYIVIRGHSLGEGNIKKINSATLFTGEKHDYHKYIREQYEGQVGMGVPYLYSEINEMGGFENLMDETYFVFGSEFIEELMVGKFPDSTIILAGCETTKEQALANSFLKRGASEVIGWSGLVDIDYNDRYVMHFLNQTLVHDVETKNIIDSINERLHGRLVHETQLVHYTNDV